MANIPHDDVQTFAFPSELVLSDPALPTTDRARLWVDPILGGVEATSCRFLHHRFAPHVHDTLMIGLIGSGAKRFDRTGRTHVVGTGGISLVNPGEAHTGSAANENELIYRALYLPVTLLAGESDLEFRAATLADRRVFGLLWGASDAIMSRAPILEREERVLAGAALLGSRYSAPRLTTHSTAPWRVQKARDILGDGWADTISVERIAREVDLSPYHLMRSFHRHFGLPMHAYQLGLRIDRARDLLRRGDDTVAEIALVCGFADQSHFTRRFKAHVGIGPAAYRRDSQR